ncbi:G-type lectin S-receptor-like serine/threonine-protein kinase At4g27290 isoform X2 [Andrographis paniculata]|uniref:G-type lectin S-receptor-like serine/threonine-protein kinase At4g27290 isoform X2 n=1 Tax=Andrographis paniculata TaxID=175694 RepID=UPI0021E86637|nr:G-type lectin S-receptor-like serine/threonine-protein kinase At4g27290 isoform X2 [Andrographis paniculata]
MNRSIREATFILIISHLLSPQNLSYAADAMDATQSVTYNQTLVSAGSIFELGFFSPQNPQNWYLGIWYKKVSVHTPVWVANREAPLRTNSSGVLKIIAPGILVLLNDTNHTLWSSSGGGGAAGNPIVQLLDSGNLILRNAGDDNPRNRLWQSFDYPTDTYLSGMMFGLNSVYLSSWKTAGDPSPGEYKLYFDPTGYPQVFTERDGAILHRIGPWNGLVFSGTPYVTDDPSFKFGVYRNEEGRFYLRDDALDQSVMSRVTLSTAGALERWRWVDQTQEWILQMSVPMDNCDTYNSCGAYGSCFSGGYRICSCLDKFEPKDPKGWPELDWSRTGCVRRTPLNCSARDGFVKYSSLKLPDARGSWYDERMTLKECREKCLKNCSCTAYTRLNVSEGGSGCLLYFGDLADIRSISKDEQDLFVRMAASELDSAGKKNVKLIASVTIVGAAVLLSVSIVLCMWRKKNKNSVGRIAESHGSDLELPLFDLSTISKATNKFSIRNKIGEGGYGPVYKGTLRDGQDIAVKRLSENSKQGVEEFKNEVIFVAKLQHRNLVKLLGCCIQGEEKMLIYEYMPNGSLDNIIFDRGNGISLDWPTRFRVVMGIARGLMYLHEDSQLRIIHRDLKASNILLDGEMNPKISDFGIAKRYKGNDQTEDITNRVVGTHGYMSPEYASRGRFSAKSDVFSFGVIVLEIISGKRNSSYSQGDFNHNLLAHAWAMHMEGRSIEVVDWHLQKSEDFDEVARVIHVGLLCVQQHPRDRPSMTSVVAMLSNVENEGEMPRPRQPGFFMKTRTLRCCDRTSSDNEMTITVLDGR